MTMLFSHTTSPNSSVFGLFLLSILALAGDGNADALALVGFFQNQNVARSSSSRCVFGCHQQLFKSPATERETKTATSSLSLSLSLSLKPPNDDEIEKEMIGREDESTKQAIENDSNNDLKWIEKIKQRVVEKAQLRRWTDFLGEVALFLRADDWSEDDVETSLVGLMIYGIRKREDLLGISDTKAEFRRRLEAKGVIRAISDKLFKQYVEPELRLAATGGTNCLVCFIIVLLSVQLTMMCSAF